MFLDLQRNALSQAGVAEWLSRWPRDPRSMIVGKLASGLRARRGSNPFPGANIRAQYNPILLKPDHLMLKRAPHCTFTINSIPF
jgi:hypothetical protein